MAETKQSPEDRERFREVFDLFDRSGSGKIEVKNVGNVLRGLGEHPTEAQVKGAVREHGGDNATHITFQQLCSIMSTVCKDDFTNCHGIELTLCVCSSTRFLHVLTKFKQLSNCSATDQMPSLWNNSAPV